ncbi:MAG: LytTR family transcriptional regulator DNA-binding domain-containing protein [Sphingobacteriaceae bacterium]
MKSKTKQKDTTECIICSEKNTLLSKDKLILIAKRKSMFFIRIENISKCQAIGNKTVFHFYNDENIIASKCLKEYELKLKNNGFIKINRGTMIPIKSIKFVSKNSVGLIDGSDLRLSNKQKINVNEIAMTLID